jgi:hypothetical protein
MAKRRRSSPGTETSPRGHEDGPAGPLEASLDALAGSLADLARRAGAAYAPLVESLVRDRCHDAPLLERTLDGLLGFAFDPVALGLFERLRAYYSGMDLAAADRYADFYREMWEDPEHRGDAPPGSPAGELPGPRD